jgi:hypothetical protein
MEHLFSPCTRLRDTLQREGYLRYETALLLQDISLDVSSEEFLSAESAFTYADLYAMLEDREPIAWLTPHAFVMVEDGRTVVHCWEQLDHAAHRVDFNADGKEIVAWALSPDHLLEICDVVLRLLAASVVRSVQVTCDDFEAMTPAASFEYLMVHCQSLKCLSLMRLRLDENLCRALGAYSRSDLEIELHDCTFTRAGTSALAGILGRNQGLTRLDGCRIVNSILADGLRGNSRLKSLKLGLDGHRQWFSIADAHQGNTGQREDGNRQLLAIANALRENTGLVELELRSYGFIVSDETWGAVCDSLKTHPTLEVLDLQGEPPKAPAPDVITSRMQVLVDMLKVNTTIHTIRLDSCYSEHELFRGSVIPNLETRRLRPRLLAIQTTRPMAYRVKVLGRALLAVGTDPNCFWMLLSGNAEVAFLSTAATTTPAANLPTIDAATSTTYVGAAVTTSVMSALMTTATGSLPTAAAPAATSTTTPSTASALDPAVAAAAANVARQKRNKKRNARRKKRSARP